MSRPEIVVLSAHGASTFSAGQRRRLERVARVRWVAAPSRLSPAAFRRVVDGASVAGLNPRGTPPLTPALLDALPTLRAVAIPTTGHDWLDTGLLKARGIRVAYVPGFSSDSTAEFTFALVLALCRRLPAARAQALRGGRAGRLRGIELRGRTLGVVGLGATGSRVARIGRGFGMRVLGADVRRRRLAGVQQVDLPDLLRSSDVVSLHVPVDARTRGFVDAAALERMRQGAFLVNTARPDLVDTRSVLASLRRGRLGGYAFDLGYASRRALAPLVRDPRVLAVPHVSWYTDEALAREIDGWIDGLARLATGRRCHLV